MSGLTEKELNNLSIMYEGDKKRDASDKIRGFLFQDFVAIMCLLQNQVEYVCSEYLEDVDVFFEDGTFEFIQVKYYPKTEPKMEEISTDLYYQYLRLQILESNLKATPRLYIHREKVNVNKPTLEKMKMYLKIENKSIRRKSIIYSEFEDPVGWLRTNIYPKNKEEQKKSLFNEMASEESLEKFLEDFEIIPKKEIGQYKEELKRALAEVYPNPDLRGDSEHWQCILLGLAVSYVQRRYMLPDPGFSQLRMKKAEFDSYMTEATITKTEQTIASYLSGIVCEKYGEIVNYNELSDLQTHMLYMIYQNTMCWINKIGKTVEGQYQLLNTYSTDDLEKLSHYKGSSLDERLRYVAECKQNFIAFLEYLWKIMLNLCQEKIGGNEAISQHLELFDPRYYIVCSVTDYICLNFPEDKCINHSVILPRVGGNFKGVKRKIVERMMKLSQKPEKWFFENNSPMWGKNYYNYSTANVNENPTVADLGEDSFYIECMACIKVDEGDWNKKETCENCIFSMNCVKGEE